MRFGCEWFEAFCRRHGTEIVVMNAESLSPDAEMVKDLLSRRTRHHDAGMLIAEYILQLRDQIRQIVLNGSPDYLQVDLCGTRGSSGCGYRIVPSRANVDAPHGTLRSCGSTLHRPPVTPG